MEIIGNGLNEKANEEKGIKITNVSSLGDQFNILKGIRKSSRNGHWGREQGWDGLEERREL